MVSGNITISFILLTIVASLLSGLIAVIISSYYYSRLERRKFKEDTVRRLIGNRFNIYGDEFSRALNEIFIVFSDSKPVITALEIFWEELQRSKKSMAEDKLLKLLKAICKNVGINLTYIDDSQFLKAFNIKKSPP